MKLSVACNFDDGLLAGLKGYLLDLVQNFAYPVEKTGSKDEDAWSWRRLIKYFAKPSWPVHGSAPSGARSRGRISRVRSRVKNATP